MSVAQSWSAAETVAPEKTWQIRFNSPVNEEQELTEHIQILDRDNRLQAIRAELNDGGKTVSVTPVTPLASGPYQLVILDTLKDNKGRPLQKEVRFNFKVAGKAYQANPIKGGSAAVNAG